MKTEINQEIQKNIDNIVIAFHAGKTDQKALEVVQDWLEVDGWDELIADLDDGLAVNIEALADDFFNDDYAAFELDVDEDDLTDGARIQIGRDRFDEVFNEDNESFVDTLHCHELVATNGLRAFLTCIIQVMGQGGPMCFWTGLVTDREQFLEDIKKKGVYWFPRAWGPIPDDGILSRWTK